MNRKIKAYLSVIVVFLFLISCEENERFKIGYDDNIPPSAPQFLNYKPTYGGARIFFNSPDDADLLSIDATYINNDGKELWFSVSFYSDYIDVYGFANEEPHTIQLFAVDRAGNRSEKIPVKVVPLKPAVEQVIESMYCVPGFSSFYINWSNGLMKSMNIFVNYSFKGKDGKEKESHVIFTSRQPEESQYIRNPGFTTTEPVNVKVHVEDEYGNASDVIELGDFNLLEDNLIPKDAWQIPAANDSTIVNRFGERVNTGVPMGFFNGGEGRDYMAIDGIINDGRTVNFTHTWYVGRTGNPKDGNMPWNYIIDLGDYYDLSRIITHQRYAYAGATEHSGRLDYYRNENVGIFSLWRWDEEVQEWDSLTTHKITYPEGATSRQLRTLGQKGDMAYMYPRNPRFTKPTRWFRYEAKYAFTDNYKAETAQCISEITLYGRKSKVEH